MDTQELGESIIGGDENALARGLTLVENRSEGYKDLLEYLFPRSSSSYILGITGPPGAGKSSITTKLALDMVDKGQKVGILAIDPTSPFSGGALLGDRIRMGELVGRENVFIRSMASRGALGGLSPAVLDAILLMEAYGSNTVIIETVGVGQSETDIAGVADTVLIILMPGIGDDVQTIKAGLLEIGDLFVINKADHEGAGELSAFLEGMLNWQEKEKEKDWNPPVLKTVAISSDRMEELLGKIEEHKDFLQKTDQGEKKGLRRAGLALKTHMKAELEQLFLKPLLDGEDWRQGIIKVQEREAFPGEVVRSILEKNFPNIWR